MIKNCSISKLHLFALLLLVFSGFVGKAQVGQSYWKFISPSPFGFTVQRISFYDDNNGIAVGDGGGIARTTDGGATWQYGVFTFTDGTATIQKPTFNDVHYVAPNIAYAVGNYGLFAKTIDGGLTWTAMNNPFKVKGSNSTMAYAVCFTSPTVGYIGGTKLVTTSAAPYLYRTLDGGATWDSIPAPVGDSSWSGTVAAPVKNQITSTNKIIYAIKFTSANIGYISGSGSGTVATAGSALLWKFNSGVLTDYSVSKEKLVGFWVPPVSGSYSQYSPCTQTYPAMQPVNDSLVLMASQNNMVVMRVSTGVDDKTNDLLHPGQTVKGKYEIVQYTAIPATNSVFTTVYNMWSMAKAPDGKVYVTYGNGQLGVTADNGTTWSLIKSFPVGQSYSGLLNSTVAITPNGRIFNGAAEGAISDSLPGQVRRTIYTSINKSPLSGGVNKMAVADCNNIMSVGGFGTIQASTDGGKTWVDKSNATETSISYYGLAFPKANKAYWTTSAGYVYSSGDMATTKDLILNVPALNGAGTTMYGIDVKGDSIWAMGRRGGTVNQSYVFRSFNAGLTWDTIMPFAAGSTSSSVNYIKFATNTIGYIIGSRGKMYKTTDAGATWADISPDPAYTSSLNDIYLLDKDNIFVVGTLGKAVYKTSNGGASWTNVSVNITNQFIGILNSIIMNDVNNGYIFSISGTTLVTNDGGTTWTVINAPTNTTLSAAVFVPNIVPPGTPFLNRRVVVGTFANGHFLEYGNNVATNLAATEIITNASCTQLNGGSITINASGGIAPYSYSLDGGAFQSSNIFTGLVQGSHTYIIKENYGCNTLTKTVSVGFNDNLTLATSPTNSLVCENVPVNLTATSQAGATYSWSPAAGLSATNISNPVANTATTTIYTVTSTLNGCVRTAKDTITVKNLTLSVSPTNSTVCENVPVQLTASTVEAGSSFAWSPAAGLSATNIANPIANTASTTTYTVVASLNGCTKSAIAVVNIKNLSVSATPTTTSVCENTPVQLNATSVPAGATFAWSPASGLSNANIANPVATTKNATLYTVTASYLGCTKTATVNLNIMLNPVVNAGPDKTIFAGDAVTLEGSGPNGAQSIAWAPAASLTGGNTYSPTATPQTTTTYTLTVRDYNSCSASDNMVVTVVADCIKPMEAFTPNGDGINEYWLITNGNCLINATASVFNRYGARVFESKDYKNNWNGTYNGKPLPDGTYYYIITYKLINGKLVEQKGNVTILR